MGIKNQTKYGDYYIQVDKSPVTFYTGYSDWIRTVTIYNNSKEMIMQFLLDDVNSQVLSTGLYMFYSDETFNNEFNFDPNFGADILLDFDLLEIINPLVCQTYDIEYIISQYNEWGMIGIDLPSVSINLDKYSFLIQGYNGKLEIKIYHLDKNNIPIQELILTSNNVEEIYSLSQLINDELDSLVTNFIQNNI